MLSCLHGITWKWVSFNVRDWEEVRNSCLIILGFSKTIYKFLEVRCSFWVCKQYDGDYKKYTELDFSGHT